MLGASEAPRSQALTRSDQSLAVFQRLRDDGTTLDFGITLDSLRAERATLAP